MKLYCKVLSPQSAEVELEVNSECAVIDLIVLMKEKLPWLPSDFKILHKGKTIKSMFFWSYHFALS